VSGLQRLLRLVTLDPSPLQGREFRLLFIGQVVTLLGTMTTTVAVPFQVYRLTGSPLAVGLLGLAEILPVLGLAFLGGALADARERRGMVLVTELAAALSSILLVLNSLLDQPVLWLIYAVTAAQGGLYALQRPSLDALLPRIVPRHELAAASALATLRGTFGMLLGPAIAGVLIASIGLPATYALDAMSFLLSAAAIGLMREVPPSEHAEQPSLRRVIEGLQYARTRPELIGTYVVDMVAMFFGMPTALFPAVADAIGGGPSVLGLLYAAPAGGAFVASLTSGWTRHVHRQGLAILLAASGWGLAIILFGLAASAVAAVVLLGLAGAADAVSGIFRTVIWNRTIPDELRGRLASIELLSYSSGPALSGVESGVVAALFDTRTSILSGGILCVLGCAVCALLLPAFRAYDERAWQNTC
jgi:MFS family permease